MTGPFVQVINPQSEMVVAIGWRKCADAPNEVKLLAGAETKPCAGEVEGWPRNGLKMQDTTIKIAAALDIRDVEGNVVQFVDGHTSICSGNERTAPGAGAEGG